MPPPSSNTDQPTVQPPPGRPYLKQLSIQLGAAFIVLSVAWPYFLIRNEALPWPHTALVIGAAGLLLASVTRQAWWWRLIHTVFAPAAAAVAALGIDPGWFLAAFVLLLLVYRGALTGQIPLYFSNQAVATAIAELVAESRASHFVDLGAGIGSVVAALARRHPDLRITGIENAPATWLVGYLRTHAQGNCEWRWGDLWRTDLRCYDIAYAFLSPAPMTELWAKVEREMPPGSLFISNSFVVPGRDAERIIEVDDARATRLYCYRVAPAA